jgi:hypothetical protein
VHSWKAYGYGGTAVIIFNLGSNMSSCSESRYGLFVLREIANPTHIEYVAGWAAEPTWDLIGGVYSFACTGN